MGIRYSFFVPMTPVGKGRPRVTRNGMHTYTPAKTVAAEELIRAHAIAAGVRPIDGPVKVEIRAVFEPPKSWSKKRQRETTQHTSKPDLDNLVKLLDALEESPKRRAVAFKNDSQICSLIATKEYGAPEGLYITVASE